MLKIDYKKPYECIPSAFTVIEYPTYKVNDEWNNLLKNNPRIEQNNAEQASECVRYATRYAKCFKFRKAASPLKAWLRYKWGAHYPLVKVMGLSIIAFSILTPLTPVTMLIDPIIGIAEIVFALYKGEDSSTLRSIAHKKFIASPAQHFVCITIELLTLAIMGFSELGLIPYNSSLKIKISFVFVNAGVAGFGIYPIMQKAVTALPNYCRPDGFNIFINGGAPDEYGKKYTAEAAEKTYQSYRKEWDNSTQKDWGWSEFIDGTLKDCNLEKVASATTEYDKFKNRLIDKKSTQELLELAKNFTSQQLKTKYHQLFMALHPDKNRDNQEEAKTLSQCLIEAKCRLEKELEKRPH